MARGVDACLTSFIGYSGYYNSVIVGAFLRACRIFISVTSLAVSMIMGLASRTANEAISAAESWYRDARYGYGGDAGWEFSFRGFLFFGGWCVTLLFSQRLSYVRRLTLVLIKRVTIGGDRGQRSVGVTDVANGALESYRHVIYQV